jgi:hypothetical protein
MIIEEKNMTISQMCRADSALQEPKSAARGMMQRFSLTLLACTLTIIAAEAQQKRSSEAGHHISTGTEWSGRR